MVGGGGQCNRGNLFDNDSFINDGLQPPTWNLPEEGACVELTSCVTSTPKVLNAVKLSGVKKIVKF